MNYTEYIKGGIDCRNGKPCPDNAHKDYIRGYSYQHELEQVLTARSLRGSYGLKRAEQAAGNQSD